MINNLLTSFKKTKNAAETSRVLVSKINPD